MPHMSNLPWMSMYIIVFTVLMLVFLFNSNQNHPSFNLGVSKMIYTMTTWKW